MTFISEALVFSFLPETLGVSLPETISEADQFQPESQTRNLSVQTQENLDETTPLLGTTS